MAYDTLLWLQNWFLDQCDGDREHQEGVKITTLDNPGWSLEINLMDTEMAEMSFETTNIERSEHDWVFCELVAGRFKAACGPLNLVEAIETFRSWIRTSALIRYEKRKSARLGG